MDKYEKDMIMVVNRNRDCKALAGRLNAISARRRRKKGLFGERWERRRWRIQRPERVAVVGR